MAKKRRRCLNCQKKFWSSGDRICPPCHYRHEKEAKDREKLEKESGFLPVEIKTFRLDNVPEGEEYFLDEDE